MQAVVSRDDPDVDSAVSWSAYHARLQPEDAVSGSDVALASLLPLFSEEAKSVAMIRHSMDVVKKSVEILNPGQIPIITVDQPLFAVAVRSGFQSIDLSNASDLVQSDPDSQYRSTGRK